MSSYFMSIVHLPPPWQELRLFYQSIKSNLVIRHNDRSFTAASHMSDVVTLYLSSTVSRLQGRSEDCFIDPFKVISQIFFHPSQRQIIHHRQLHVVTLVLSSTVSRIQGKSEDCFIDPSKVVSQIWSSVTMAYHSPPSAKCRHTLSQQYSQPPTGQERKLFERSRGQAQLTKSHDYYNPTELQRLGPSFLAHYFSILIV